MNIRAARALRFLLLSIAATACLLVFTVPADADQYYSRGRWHQTADSYGGRSVGGGIKRSGRLHDQSGRRGRTLSYSDHRGSRGYSQHRSSRGRRLSDSDGRGSRRSSWYR